MLKNTLLIALLILVIYLYYQKQNTLANFTGASSPQEIAEVKKVNQIMAEFCRNEIGGKDINEIRTKLNGRKLTEILAENEDYETEVDTLTRNHKELEAEVLSLNNAYQNRVSEKEQIIKRLEQEHKDLQSKYNKKTKQLDEEQLENNKLTEQNEFYLESIQTKEKIISDYQKEIQELEAKITSLESEDKKPK